MSNKPLALVKFKKRLQTYRPGEVYVVDQKNLANLPKGFADVYPYDILPAYDGTQPNFYILRSGGLGDLFALSCLQDMNPTVITNRENFAALDWWRQPPKRKTFQQPLFTVKYPEKMETVAKRYGVLRGEDAIELGSRQNWMEIFNLAAGRSAVMEADLRPDLDYTKASPLFEGQCLIVSKSTSINRSADTDTIRQVAQKYFQSVVISENLGRLGVKRWLEYLAMADFVISVDTSAIHFREGVRLPALGLYSSFEAESRTRYYRYTTSVNISSPCELQPCHLRNQIRCPKAAPEATAAPCLSPGYNPTLAQQIDHALSKLLT